MFQRIGRPLFVCEPVLAEAAHLVSPRLVARMVADGDLVIRFSVQEQIGRIRELLEKYAARMDFADACVVRMSELFPDCMVYTSDVEDFRIYRRFGDKEIPCCFIG
ncbi:MAG: pilus assembly protein [Verrucomicrobiae bacterium]|nr:pilus assembly protein [Verrucomicrobiae bacterium]